ncbi:hypothetical protein L5515_019572 [Caenorhabditis briggsae]|uniref:Uncharacterized protein n=1 Tax=Caenorhabditis briggsae TaxID=6238 RepID=A0AAE9FKR6_CAEBR|nr:hypothetical protein L5515_019572 [Caenorhabditis briggsae]
MTRATSRHRKLIDNVETLVNKWEAIEPRSTNGAPDCLEKHQENIENLKLDVKPDDHHTKMRKCIVETA